jgi:vacuolar-type H+-ATPase subunit E/Vma4
MGYRELLRALEEEVGRQIAAIQAEAGGERQRLLEETQRELAAEREETLARARRRLQEETARALARGRLEQERAVLGEMRHHLAELRRDVEARLSTLSDATLLGRLVDELMPELGEGPLDFRVETGQEERLRDHLRGRDPGMLSRATITGSAGLHGGVQVALGGGQLLDNTLPSRLEKAWPLLEGQTAALLFGEGDGGV